MMMIIIIIVVIIIISITILANCSKKQRSAFKGWSIKNLSSLLNLLELSLDSVEEVSLLKSVENIQIVIITIKLCENTVFSNFEQKR